MYIEYFCAFGIVLLVPLDLSLTIVGRRSGGDETYYEDNVHTIIDMYLSMYWPILVLSNVVLVFEEIFNASGTSPLPPLFFKILTSKLCD